MGDRNVQERFRLKGKRGDFKQRKEQQLANTVRQNHIREDD